MKPTGQLMEAPPAPVSSTNRSVVGNALLALPNLARLMWGLARDRRVSVIDKALVVGAALYFIMPLDLVPDFLPFFGEVDDLVVILMTVRRLIRNAGLDVVLDNWKGDPKWITEGKVAKLLGVAATFLPGARARRR